MSAQPREEEISLSEEEIMNNHEVIDLTEEKKPRREAPYTSKALIQAVKLSYWAANTAKQMACWGAMKKRYNERMNFTSVKIALDRLMKCGVTDAQRKVIEEMNNLVKNKECAKLMERLIFLIYITPKSESDKYIDNLILLMNRTGFMEN